MSLPLLEIPTYELELLSVKKTIKYRPFLVKEQKVLLTALHTGEKKDALIAMLGCIKACTFNEVDIDALPSFDLERLFLHIRAKSVGEELPLKFQCEKCKAYTDVTLKLLDYKISHLDDIKDRVPITGQYGFVFRYPTAEIMSKVVDKVKESTDIGFYYETAKACLIGVYEGEDFYSSADATEAEKNSVFDQLSDEQFIRIRDFFDTIPTISYNIPFTCSKCNAENTMTLEGLDSFFG